MRGKVIYHKIIGQSEEDFSTFPISQLKSCPSLGQLHGYQAGAWRAIARREAIFPPFEPEPENSPLYQGIGAHEFGHAVGLSDLDDGGKLTMHFQGTLGYPGQRTPGRGDILGARALYGD